MSIALRLQDLSAEFTVLGTMDLDTLDADYEISRQQITEFCRSVYRVEYQDRERIIFTSTKDYYDDDPVGIRLRTVQRVINEIDISNFFVIVVSTNPDVEQEAKHLTSISSDSVGINALYEKGAFEKLPGKVSRFESYRYGSPDPVKIKITDLTDREKFLLVDSKVFCIYPWIHLHVYPTGQTYPCCHWKMSHPVGDSKKSTLEDIWRDEPMQAVRNNMLNEISNPGCSDCYEQESAGFFSGRQSANKHHGHHIKHLDRDEFRMTYWDIRFSNLCNLRCRSCGHIFSSQWYNDQAKLAGPEWKKNNRVLNYAGRSETDMWEQLLPHLDYVEQIYFAGGEPLIMEEHYKILEELEKRGKFDVHLIYNTNFTEVRLKDRLVFDYWKKFDKVSVGASLDGMGPHAEYIRKGTDWDQVERNREKMLEICPQTDFYVSLTLSIMNGWHVSDFHRSWTERGLINAKDFNINILQNPSHFRLDIAPMKYKQRLRMKLEEHLEWLRPLDSLRRATVGFESAIKYMMETDNTQLIPVFWQKINQLDEIRRERLLDVIPELEALNDENSTH